MPAGFAGQLLGAMWDGFQNRTGVWTCFELQARQCLWQGGMSIGNRIWRPHHTLPLFDTCIISCVLVNSDSAVSIYSVEEYTTYVLQLQ